MADWLRVLTEVDRGHVVPTAAVVSAVVAMAVRWWDSPRAVLRMEVRLTATAPGQIVQSSGVGDGPTVTGRVALLNVGNGDAFDVKVFGSKCDPAIEVEPHNWVYALPVIKAGESAIVVVGGNVDRSKTRDAAIIVTWSARPGRWTIRKHLRTAFSETAVAELFPPGLLPVKHIPRWVRRTRTLESRSPRALRYQKLLADQDGAAQSTPSPDPP